MRASISSQLRNSLQGLNIASELLEQAVLLVTNDNLDLGCALIEQAATEKVRIDQFSINWLGSVVLDISALALILYSLGLGSFLFVHPWLYELTLTLHLISLPSCFPSCAYLC